MTRWAVKEVPGTTRRTGLYSLSERICHVSSEVTWEGCPADNHQKKRRSSFQFLKDGQNSSQNDMHPFATRIWGEVIWCFWEFIVCWLAWLAFVCLSPTDCAHQCSPKSHTKSSISEQSDSARWHCQELGFPWSFTTVWCQTMELPTSLKHSR